MSWGYSYGGFDNGTAIGRQLAIKHPVKPKKTVFPSDQAIHVWAQQNQAYGRNSKGTIFFDGETLYSYGYHFAMGSFVRPGVVFINAAHSSKTTNGHLYTVRRAVSQHEVFVVDDPLARTPAEHEENLKSLLKGIENAKAVLANPRRGGYAKTLAERIIIENVERANAYQKLFFPRRRKPAAVLPEGLSNEVSRAKIQDYWRAYRREFNAYMRSRKFDRKGFGRFSQIIDSQRRLASLYKIYRLSGGEKPSGIDLAAFLKVGRYARAALKRIAPFKGHDHGIIAGRKIRTAQIGWDDSEKFLDADSFNYIYRRGFAQFDNFARTFSTESEKAERQREYEAYIADIRKQEEERRALLAKTSAAKMESWRRGDRVPDMHDLPCMLRVQGQKVMTSWGAEFPVTHAQRAWPAISSVLSEGRQWKSNGKSIHLGNFSIDEICEDGTVIAGCHRISRQEVERCAKELRLL